MIMNIETKNAIITSTHLGDEDHGIMTCYLHLDFGGSGQGFGGYSLDQHNGERNANSRRIGTAYGLEFIKRILETLEVGKWEKLPGTHLRVKADHGKVHSIGHFIKDQWFTPETDLAAFAKGGEQVTTPNAPEMPTPAVFPQPDDTLGVITSVGESHPFDGSDADWEAFVTACKQRDAALAQPAPVAAMTPPPALNEEAVQACAREIVETITPFTPGNAPYDTDRKATARILRKHLSAERKEGV
jgi:hypothetical protein